MATPYRDMSEDAPFRIANGFSRAAATGNMTFIQMCLEKIAALNESSSINALVRPITLRIITAHLFR
jgi:hypothetical protein